MSLTTTVLLLATFARTTRAVGAVSAMVRKSATGLMGKFGAIYFRGSRSDIYNILWAVVFGFATLNIISLAGRRLEPTRRGLSFGELMAVTVVLVSIVLLGWEMLNLLHIFPVQLRH
jgi:hypothetical protein